MATYDKEGGLIPNRGDGSAQQTQDAAPELFADVRSTVESQFRQMDQAHDRIRAEELTARLSESPIQ